MPRQPIPEPPLPDQPLPPLPPPEELLPPADPALPEAPLDGTDGTEATFFVSTVEITGSTVFSPANLADLVAPYLNRQVSFRELLELRNAITERYVAAGYVTSGAILPPQTLVGDQVIIQAIEGELEDIVVTGLNRLSPAYVRSRLGQASTPPLNVDRLLAGLQRLQLNPLIETVVADLQAGSRANLSVLVVNLAEADSLALDLSLDNYGAASVGAEQRRVLLSEGNLSGLGDRITLTYENTDGSNGVDLSYTLPVSPNNDALRVRAGYSSSRVIDPNFQVLDISSSSVYYDLGYRHTLIETPTEDLTLGLTLGHQQSQTRLGLDDIGPFPLSPGADSEGITRVTALRFSQQWTQRSQSHVLAFRSQFSLGLDWLSATRNPTGPDSRFLAWRGQGQWLQRFGPDTLLLLRGDTQLASNDLLSPEKFGLGGALSVRGYGRDVLLRDSGVLLSAELRSPIARVPDLDATLQIVPFLDAGVAWNVTPGLSSGPNTLVGTGLGLLWQQGDRLSTRVDLGLPLIPLAEGRNVFQGSSVYFSVRYTPF
ncbi:ShlB/FhaC/HecB family hemolysin secretion/activation protein [Leptolyngbya sp. KIOST-1]|uniref:ShlB/FhaC/HecB family hemolysin secretion/activation protein n=1 Tax=Leptolyngbya sp. KIOST-1 TaxID=1229172 RepID=UPI00068A6A6E|nr:ShlB/FhaC/HecB family hemolysin secretion/activation protein [Leptolyngbya sp. KIOST-1]